MKRMQKLNDSATAVPHWCGRRQPVLSHASQPWRVLPNLLTGQSTRRVQSSEMTGQSASQLESRTIAAVHSHINSPMDTHCHV